MMAVINPPPDVDPDVCINTNCNNSWKCYWMIKDRLLMVDALQASPPPIPLPPRIKTEEDTASPVIGRVFEPEKDHEHTCHFTELVVVPHTSIRSITIRCIDWMYYSLIITDNGGIVDKCFIISSGVKVSSMVWLYLSWPWVNWLGQYTKYSAKNSMRSEL